MRPRFLLLATLLSGSALWAGEAGPMALEPVEGVQMRLSGWVGDRARANLEGWLLHAPASNPGMLEMFRVRDRDPEPRIVPWAGEFAGKYLLSGIGALRLTDDPRLRRTLARVVEELISTQAEDGYLGPFPRRVRLRENWDLWGHYFCMQALLRWEEATGDPAARRAVLRAADLICDTFLEGALRVHDAGSHEMNMAIHHVMAELHRRTGAPRYGRMALEVEKDWERAGDYLRTGVAGIEFYRTPRPRWESLHDLQGLVERFRITGQPEYRTAFEHHWRSIRRWDRHNTGGFSSGEQATGNPYAPGAIETCCTVAWMVLSCDMHRLSGDPGAADELELAFFNGGLGSQHPSGRWWTYNTPMDGVKEASAHSIVFQARAGTPELNCCSVNGPRILGMLPDWAVLRTRDGWRLNYYGPSEIRGRLGTGASLRLTQRTDYPRSGEVEILVEPERPVRFTLECRVPAWAEEASLRINGRRAQAPTEEGYLKIDRQWRRGDRVSLQFPLRLRIVSGDREVAGRISLYRGPILLAWDQRVNARDERDLKPIPASALPREVEVKRDPSTWSPAWMLVELSAGGELLRLVDFASAGSAGTPYRSWLPATGAPPPPVVPKTPHDRREVSGKGAWFKWSGPRLAQSFAGAYRLDIAPAPDFREILWSADGIPARELYLGEEVLSSLPLNRPLWWRVRSVNGQGSTWEPHLALQFRLNPALPPEPAQAGRPDRLLVRAALDGRPEPEVGRIAEARGVEPAEGRRPGEAAIAVRGGKLRYQVEQFPEEEYTLAVWVFIEELPGTRLGQILSSWASGMNDPIRLPVTGGKLYARIEAGHGYSTEGVPVTPRRWMHVAAVKEENRLTLYVDGEARTAATVPASVHSSATDFALGGNPHFSGDESLRARFSDLHFFEKALTPEEIRRLAAP